MKSRPVTIDIIDEVTSDAVSGLELYANLALGSGSSDLTEQWLYWFRNNPFGKGLFALAKHRDRVVGIYTLIPVEMRLSGRPAKGAKAEFLAVAPDHRAATVGDVRLSHALVSELHRRSADWGIEGIFAVVGKTAVRSMLFGGAKPVSYDCREYRTFFARPKTNRYRHRLLNFCVGCTSQAQSALMRALG